MLGADGALMNAKQPALQERRNPVHPWHRYMRRIPALRQHGPAVRVAVLSQAVIAVPAIRLNLGVRLGHIADEGHKAIA